MIPYYAPTKNEARWDDAHESKPAPLPHVPTLDAIPPGPQNAPDWRPHEDHAQDESEHTQLYLEPPKIPPQRRSVPHAPTSHGGCASRHEETLGDSKGVDHMCLPHPREKTMRSSEIPFFMEYGIAKGIVPNSLGSV